MHMAIQQHNSTVMLSTAHKKEHLCCLGAQAPGCKTSTPIRKLPEGWHLINHSFCLKLEDKGQIQTSERELDSSIFANGWMARK